MTTLIFSAGGVRLVAFLFPLKGAPSIMLGQGCLRALAHRNRSDFCDLRLRCPSRTPEFARFLTEDKAMLHCDLRVRWKVASDLRFGAAISEPGTRSFCGISGDLTPSTQKSLAIAIVRFWCAKLRALFGRTIYFHLKWVKMGFCQWAEMGPKVGLKWVLGCRNGSKVGRNPLLTHFKPISGFSGKPTF